MHKKILISAGGTGGHIYPAQGLAQQLKKHSSQHEILFVAGGLHTNRYFERVLFPYQEVACSLLLSKNPLKVGKGIWNLIRGVYQSLKIIRQFKPDVVVGFGSYYTVPTLLAAKIAKIPIVLHEANSIPGKANKWLASYVDCIGVHFPSTCHLLGKKAIEVGMPLREGYRRSSLSKNEARAYFQLDPDVPTLLIFGGSQGAQAINHLMKSCIQDGAQLSVQLIHLTGNEQNVEEFTQFYQEYGIKACVKAFEKQMNLAWQAADIFMGRSGASTVAEAMEFEVPGILIPYPYATDNHQEINANFLAQTVKGGVKYREKELTSTKLKHILTQCLQSYYINQMREAIHSYKTRSAKMDLCQVVLNIAKKE